jgi:hypothetical protein
MKRLLIIFLSLAFIIAGCTIKSSNGNGSTLPQSRAGEGEVLIVMDSVKWGSELGDVLRTTFCSQIPGLPQPEPYFSLKYVRPSAFRSILRQASNVIIVMTLDNKSREGEALRNYFTDESLERISNDRDIFMFTQNNMFARGQNVLYLFGQNDDQLIRNIRENHAPLKHYFLKNESSRISRKIYSGRSVETIMRKLLRDHKFYLNVPANYDLAKEDENFVWLRQLGVDDKSIIVHYEPYESEKVFEEAGLLALRERAVRRRVVDVERPSIYMKTETLMPLHLEKRKFTGKYAVEARGLWKLSDNTRGGAFLSYVFVDEESSKLYYIEGFLANPGRKKREPMRELEVILNSFRTESDMQKSSCQGKDI